LVENKCCRQSVCDLVHEAQRFYPRGGQGDWEARLQLHETVEPWHRMQYTDLNPAGTEPELQHAGRGLKHCVQLTRPLHDTSGGVHALPRLMQRI